MARQWDGAEYAWQANRPPRHRVPVPAVGDHLMLRMSAWETELREVVVIDVQDMDSDEAKADANVHDKVTTPDHRRLVHDEHGQPVTRLRDDPWPLVWVRAVDADGKPTGNTYSAREARMEGSGGWLPMDHAKRERPIWMGSRLILPGVTP